MASILHQTGGLTRLASEVGRWWYAEFTDLLPPRTAQWLTDAGGRNLVLDPARADGIGMILRDDMGQHLSRTSVAPDADPEAEIDRFLKKHRLRRHQVPLGIMLPPEKLFHRSIVLPRETSGALDQIVLADLRRNTPFRDSEIYHDFSAERTGPRIFVTQTVMQRRFLDEAATALGLAPAAFAFVEAQGAPDDDPPARITLRNGHRGNRWLSFAAAALLATALVGSASAIFLEYDRQQAQLAAISEQMAAARQQAHEVRTALAASGKEVGALNTLRAEKYDRPNLLTLWEDVSKILPDSAWIQELRLGENRDKTGYRLVLSGFADAAASLVEQLDQSPLFSDVALTAPITIDPSEKRERFMLEATVATPAAEAKP